MVVEVVLPALGLTVEKGKILKWLVKEGDTVARGDSLYEVEADKVTTEVESPASGVVRKILITEGIEVPILTVVAVITDEKEKLPGKYLSTRGEIPEKKEGPEACGSSFGRASGCRDDRPRGDQSTARRPKVGAGERIGSVFDERLRTGWNHPLKRCRNDSWKGASAGPKVLATPTARKLAEREAISLGAVKGTGPAGRVMKADVLEAKSLVKASEGTAEKAGAKRSACDEVRTGPGDPDELHEKGHRQAHGSVQVHGSPHLFFQRCGHGEAHEPQGRDSFGC